MKTEYDTQTETFLTDNGLKLRITLSDSKPAPWQESKTCHTCNGTGKQEKGWPMWHPGKCGFCNGTGKKEVPTGHHYRVTLSAPGRKRVTFDFWDSISAAEKGTTPTAYDVLACLSGDVYYPDTFEEYCDTFGENPDSLKARQAWKRCHSFAKRLRAFFTSAELGQLSEIQ